MYSEIAQGQYVVGSVLSLGETEANVTESSLQKCLVKVRETYVLK